jgi:hypothetical protein
LSCIYSLWVVWTIYNCVCLFTGYLTFFIYFFFPLPVLLGVEREMGRIGTASRPPDLKHFRRSTRWTARSDAKKLNFLGLNDNTRKFNWFELEFIGLTKLKLTGGIRFGSI